MKRAEAEVESEVVGKNVLHPHGSRKLGHS